MKINISCVSFDLSPQNRLVLIALNGFNQICHLLNKEIKNVCHGFLLACSFEVVVFYLVLCVDCLDNSIKPHMCMVSTVVSNFCK